MALQYSYGSLRMVIHGRHQRADICPSGTRKMNIVGVAVAVADMTTAAWRAGASHSDDASWLSQLSRLRLVQYLLYNEGMKLLTSFEELQVIKSQGEYLWLSWCKKIMLRTMHRKRRSDFFSRDLPHT